MIGLLGEENVFYVSPTHSEILILQMEYYLGENYFNKKNRKGCIKKVFYMLEVKISQKISFIPMDGIS